VFDRDGNLKICDFGFSSVMKKGVDFNEFCGSPEYAAPEMITRKKYLGPEVDIWSMGVILFVMVTATMPFGDPNISRLFVSIMTGKYVVPNYVSECSVR
jgi:MAP/microtubule affinity-regulating kinase